MSSDEATNDSANDSAVFACNMNGMTKAQRQRHEVLIQQLGGFQQKPRELSDGYTFCLATDAPTVLAAAEFITLERLCCPFFKFTLELDTDNDALWLSLTGRPGVKPFIAAEFNLSLD
jgi:hypothetical protein